MHQPTDRIVHTIAFVTPVVEWVHHERSIQRPVAVYEATSHSLTTKIMVLF